MRDSIDDDDAELAIPFALRSSLRLHREQEKKKKPYNSSYTLLNTAAI